MAAVNPENQAYMKCDVCIGELRAVRYCDECNEHMCQKCLGHHKEQKRSKDHQFVNIPKCSTHVTYDVTHFCNCCNTIACTECIQQDHTLGLHDVCSVGDAVQRTSAVSLGNSKRLQDNVTKMEKKISWTEGVKQMMINKSGILKTEINNRRKNVLDMVNRIADNSVLDIWEARSIFDDNVSQMSAILNECKNHLGPMPISPNVVAIIKEYQSTVKQVEASNGALENVSNVATLAQLNIEEDSSFMDKIETNTAAYFRVGSIRSLSHIKDKASDLQYNQVTGPIKNESTEINKREPEVKTEMFSDDKYLPLTENFVIPFESEVKDEIPKNADVKNETFVKEEEVINDIPGCSTVIHPDKRYGVIKGVKRGLQPKLVGKTDGKQTKVKRPRVAKLTQSPTTILKQNQHTLAKFNKTATASLVASPSSSQMSSVSCISPTIAIVHPSPPNVSIGSTSAEQNNKTIPGNAQLQSTVHAATSTLSTTFHTSRAPKLSSLNIKLPPKNKAQSAPISKSHNKTTERMFATSNIPSSRSCNSAQTTVATKAIATTITSPTKQIPGQSNQTTNTEPHVGTLMYDSKSKVQIPTNTNKMRVTASTFSAPESRPFGSQMATPTFTENRSSPTQTRHRKIPKLLHKTNISDIYFIPKRVHSKDSFIANKGDTSDVQLLRPMYTDQEMYLDVHQAAFPKSRKNHGHSLLTLTHDRHIIISDSCIHLYENDKLVKSERHTPDGYVPDAMAYIKKDVFVTVCCNKGMIRYHNAYTLEIVDTHELRYDEYKPIGPITLDPIVLFINTKEGDLFISIGSDTLMQFKSDGIMRNCSSLHQDVFKCHKCTVCIDDKNNIFGLSSQGDNSIYKFTLKGNKKTIATLNGDVNTILSAGVDNKRGLFVTYTSDNKNWIAKYTY